ncbi:MAG TPA: class I SAM-dependent methyltransferase [Gemmataceae bacterium]|jgi:ubiquinone/menaquinone biosynthesis C-methylase UbiE
MLPRVLEPEVMDTAEEARDYDSMDHATVNRVFVADFLAAWDGGNPLLDVGTGTAQIPIELCRQALTANVIAVDLAEEMLQVGRENVRRAGLQDRLVLKCCDAKHLPFPDGAFAAVISNSIMHHIPDPSEVVAEVVRVTRPRGTVFIRDLLRPTNQEMLGRLENLYAGNANAHQQKMFADSLRAALTLDEMRRLVSAIGFDPSAVLQTTDRHWTWTAIKK